ncbi:MAG: hypothetical protein FD177_671 [Desulfovibrionaceae bacterium]|nr:MAG: hypothetical protein FD177_671 [Desulfovibrionaceae bacterium]
MKPETMRAAKRTVSLVLVLWLTGGLVLMGDWLRPTDSEARGGGRGGGGGGRASVSTGPRGGTVAQTPRGAVGVGPRGGVAAAGPRGAAAVGPRGGAAVRGPQGAAVRGPGGAAAAAGPYGAVARGPYGGVVAAPRGAVAVPVPVAPAYGYGGYYGPSGSGVAAGMALGAMLTILPAAAIAVSNSSGGTVYSADGQCYQEVRKGGDTYYKVISCP